MNHRDLIELPDPGDLVGGGVDHEDWVHGDVDPAIRRLQQELLVQGAEVDLMDYDGLRRLLLEPRD